MQPLINNLYGIYERKKNNIDYMGSGKSYYTGEVCF